MQLTGTYPVARNEIARLLLMVRIIRASQMGAISMYTRGFKPRTGHPHDFCTWRLLPLYHSVISRGFSSSLTEASSAGHLLSDVAKNLHTRTAPATGIPRLRCLQRICRLQRREYTLPSSALPPGHGRNNLSDSSLFSTSRQPLLPGYMGVSYSSVADSQFRFGPVLPKQSLLRISGSFHRWINGDCSDRDVDEKKQAALCPLKEGGGGDNDEGPEHVLACDGGGEEDENNEGNRRTHVAASSSGQDERVGENDHRKMDIAFLSQKAKFKKAYEERMLDWEDIQVTMEEFPHYLRYLDINAEFHQFPNLLGLLSCLYSSTFLHFLLTQHRKFVYGHLYEWWRLSCEIKAVQRLQVE